MADNNENKAIIVPFLKWAGGKRWLVASSPEIFPENFNRYLEPFLGSGAVYFHLSPSKAILSDINSDLINTYLALRQNHRLVHRYLRAHQRAHSKRHYYYTRDQSPDSVYSAAARFIYLNRTCWNGLFRVNKQGDFNVPIGTKTSVLLDNDNFSEMSKLLRKATIKVADFEETVDSAKKGDFVFIDPPYTVKHNLNGFVKYNENLFSWADQIRLRNAVDRAVARKAKVLITNAHHQSIADLYRDFKKNSVRRASILSGKAEARGTVDEFLIKCW